MTIEQCAELLQATVGTLDVWVSHKHFASWARIATPLVRFDLDEKA